MSKSITNSRAQSLHRAWTDALAALRPATLERIMRACAREFRLDLTNARDKREYNAALGGTARDMAEFVMSYDPLLGDDGIVAYLIDNAERWGIEVPVLERPSRAQRAARETEPAPRRAGREAAPARAPRAEATAPRAATGPVLSVTIPGRPDRLISTMGIRPRKDDKPGVIRRTSKYVVRADADSGLLATCRASQVSSIVRFLRKRLADQPTIMRRVVITTKDGAVPEIAERTMARLELRSTRSGIKIAS